MKQSLYPSNTEPFPPSEWVSVLPEPSVPVHWAHAKDQMESDVVWMQMTRLHPPSLRDCILFIITLSQQQLSYTTDGLVESDRCLYAPNELTPIPLGC